MYTGCIGGCFSRYIWYECKHIVHTNRVLSYKRMSIHRYSRIHITNLVIVCVLSSFIFQYFPQHGGVDAGRGRKRRPKASPHVQWQHEGHSSATVQQVTPTLAVSTDARDTNTCSIGDWLASINPALVVYAASLADYGFENDDLLREADEADVEEALGVICDKKGHKHRILKEYRKLANSSTS